MSIHKTAQIHSSAQIGNDVEIGPYAVIGPEVVIGDRCHIMAHTTLEYTELGEECRVFPQASLGMEPQHLGYKGEKTKLVVGARNVFREGVTAHRGSMFDKGVTTVGTDGYFMALSHIAHDCRIGNKVIMANAAQLGGHVEVGDQAFISSTVGIHQFVRIGRLAILGGGAMVAQDVPPFCTAQGDRATLRGLNLVGLKRAGLKRDTIRQLKEAYQTVFHSGLTLENAMATSALQAPDLSVAMFRDFLLTSKRGFIRPVEKKGEKIEGEVLS